MIGQKNLIKTIDSFEKLPHSLLLVGERGSEEEDIISYIYKKFNLINFDLTDVIGKELIDQIYQSHTMSLYTVNLSKVSLSQQNELLKFYEEPSPYAYIVLFTENESTVLETILTRSYKLKMDLYTEEDLLQYKPTINPLALKICSTPGQLDIVAYTDIQKLYGLCNALIDSITTASYANTLSVAEKLNYADQYDKYDLYLFLKMMRYGLLEKANFTLYKKILEIDKIIWQMNNKKLQIEYLLTEMWLACLQ